MVKEIKKIDSTTHFGAAERHIRFSAEFTEFLRGKYSKKEILSVDITEVQDKYSLAGFVFGNFVSQEERYFFLFKIDKQLEFLAKIANTNNLGKGILKIGFGADGKPGSLAHFNPKGMYINLNKGGGGLKGFLQGENSFVHEYAHFLDFTKGLEDSKSPFHFESEKYNLDNNNNAFTKFVSVPMTDEDYMAELNKYNNARYLRKTIEVFARLFEATIQTMADKDINYSKYFTDRYNKSFYYPAEKIKAAKLETLIPAMINIKTKPIQKNLFEK